MLIHPLLAFIPFKKLYIIMISNERIFVDRTILVLFQRKISKSHLYPDLYNLNSKTSTPCMLNSKFEENAVVGTNLNNHTQALIEAMSQSSILTDYPMLKETFSWHWTSRCNQIAYSFFHCNFCTFFLESFINSFIQLNSFAQRYNIIFIDNLLLPSNTLLIKQKKESWSLW